MFHERLKQKDLDITFTSDSDSTLVLAEPISFSNQVINNLLSNSIKFSNPGGRIEVTCVSKMNEIDVIIKDQGIGIPRSIIANLFDYRSKTSRIGTAGEQGTGFGMPIVKFYVEQYGGDIEVESRPLEEYSEGHGTIFTVTLKKHHIEEKKVAS